MKASSFASYNLWHLCIGGLQLIVFIIFRKEPLSCTSHPYHRKDYSFITAILILWMPLVNLRVFVMKVSTETLPCVVSSWTRNKPHGHDLSDDDITSANFPLTFQSINTLFEVAMATAKVSVFFRLSGWLSYGKQQREWLFLWFNILFCRVSLPISVFRFDRGFAGETFCHAYLVVFNLHITVLLTVVLRTATAIQDKQHITIIINHINELSILSGWHDPNISWFKNK